MLEPLARYLLTHTWQLALSAAVFGVLEWRLAAAPGQKSLRRDVGADILLSYAAIVFAFPFYGAVMTRIVGLLQAHAQIEKLHHFRLWVDTLGGPAQLLIALFLADFVAYWKHRVFHQGWLWRFHAVHHSGEELDWLSNERFHPIEHFLGQVLQATSFIIVGFDPAVVGVHGMLRRTYSQFIHANVWVTYGPLDYVFVSPVMHRWHHAADRRTINANYAVFFSFFDVAFGSFALPRGERPSRYGLVSESSRSTFLGLLAHPFEKTVPRQAATPPAVAEASL